MLRTALERLLGNPRWIAAATFVLSRAGYRLFADVELDTSPLYYFLQYLDPVYLETDLFRSVMSLHHQAPLLNLVVGLALKLFGSAAFIVLDAIFVALGLAATISIADVVDRLTSRPLLAIVAAAGWAISPITVLYEGWLFYPHIVASCLAIGGSLLLRFVREQTVRSGVWFFLALGVVGLTRSTYGPLWLGAVAVLLMAVRAAPWKIILKAAAIPLLLLVLNSAKTRMYTGHGYGEAILWPNLSKKVFAKLPKKEQRRLVRRKRVTKAAEIECFFDLRSVKELRVPHPPTGVPALDDAVTPSGRPNANAIEHALIAERYYKPDAKFLIKNYPKVYLKAAGSALMDEYPRPATDDTTLRLTRNYVRLNALNEAMNRLLATPKKGASKPLALALTLSFGFAIVSAFIGRRSEERRELGAFGAFSALTILYLTMVSVLVSWGDFPRYRFEVDALNWILFVVLGAQAIPLAKKVKGAFAKAAARLRSERP